MNGLCSPPCRPWRRARLPALVHPVPDLARAVLLLGSLAVAALLALLEVVPAARESGDCNRLVAKPAHDRGLAVGLKNDLDQIPQLVRDFDFAVNEQCAQYEACGRLKPFIAADKADFHVEYELRTSGFCPEARRLKLSSMLKKYALGMWRRAC